MEKRHSVERVVSNIPEKAKERIMDQIQEVFDDQKFEKILPKERSKTPDELQIISLANKITNDVRKKYGLEPLDIPHKNIHIIEKEKWQELSLGLVAYFQTRMQAVVSCEESSKIMFMARMVHEMLHFKSYNAIQVVENTEENGRIRLELDEYRVGLEVHNRDGSGIKFSNLNEAVTEELTKRYSKKFLKQPIFREENRENSTILKEHPTIEDTDGVNLVDEDLLYMENRGENRFRARKFAYPHQREVLKILCQKLLEKNRDKFKDSDEVFEVFAKGMITGNILPMGRLIESSFGGSTLRKIGETEDPVEFKKFIGSL